MHWGWNMSGYQNQTLATGMMLFNSLKYVFALHLLLAVGSCHDRSRGEEVSTYSVKFLCTAFTFLVQQCMSKLLMQVRHGLSLDATLVLGTTFFGSVICLGIFVWVFAQYVIMDEWESRAGKDDPFVQLFSATRRVLLLTFGLATCVVMLQLVDIIWDSTPWELQWIPHDGSPLLAFLIFTVLTMLIWWPGLSVWRLAFSQKVEENEGHDAHDGHDGPTNGPEVADKMELEEEKEAVFINCPARRSERVVPPDIVGASSRHAGEDEENLMSDL